MKTVIKRSIGENQPAAAPIKVKPFNIGTPSLASRVDTIEHILDNMLHASGTSMLLGGSTGIGKTTLIRQLGRLLGLKVELVEVPHITEEKLINIPFVVFNPNGTKSYGDAKIAADNPTIQLAKSNLAALLQRLQPISDNEYYHNIKTFDPNTKALYTQLGGTDTEIPEEFRLIRQKYRTILFLDEYWRRTSMNVRNILRNILNGRIGNDRIPQGVYVIFASNLSDVGQTVEDIPSNADFKTLNIKPPTKNELFHYVQSSAGKKSEDVIEPLKIPPAGEKSKSAPVKSLANLPEPLPTPSGEPIKDEVLRTFYDAIGEEHISYDDIDKEIRTSPRRWEQILHYVNAATPVESQKDAQSLLANIEAMFRNEKQKSSLHDLVDAAVRQIIAKTGKPELKDVKANSRTNWRDTLAHQIAMKMKLGHTRSYIPVLSGPPGIGKTTAIHDIADKLNLVPIVISSDTLTPDEITGIPLPRRNKKGEIAEAKQGKNDSNDQSDNADYELQTDFSDPPLYIQIMKDAKEGAADFLSKKSDEQKRKWLKQPYKYLLFFDELNRTSQNTFNNLRRVILDKSFNDQLHLPKDMIVVAAMNPEGIGVTELTGHMKDAVDLIDAQPSWTAFENYLQNPETDDKLGFNSPYFNKAALADAKTLILRFANNPNWILQRSTEDIPSDSLKFYITLGKTIPEPLYISPREYISLYAELVSGINRQLRKHGSDYETLLPAIQNVVKEKFHHTFDTIFKKQQIDSAPGFYKNLDNWIKHIVVAMMKKQRALPSLEDSIDKVLKDPKQHLADMENFRKYMKSSDLSPAKFSDDINKYLTKLQDQETKRYELLTKDVVNKKQFIDGVIKVLDDLTSKLEFLAHEFIFAFKKIGIPGDFVDLLKKEWSKILPNMCQDLVTPKRKELAKDWERLEKDIQSKGLKDENLVAAHREWVQKAESAIAAEGLEPEIIRLVNNAVTKLKNLPWRPERK